MNTGKITAAVLAAVLMAGACPVSGAAFAVTAAAVSTEETAVGSGTYESLSYDIYSDHIEITDYTGSGTEGVVIPEMIEGLPVTVIKDNSFYSCGASSITLPSTLEVIETCAFVACSGLTTIDIPANVTEIGDRAFQRCSSLEEINVAFDNTSYSSLDGVLFTEDMKTLLKYPENSYVIDYNIPETVTRVADNSFTASTKLRSLYIHENLEYISPYTLSEAESLEKIYVFEGNQNYMTENGVLFNKDKTELLLYPRNCEAEVYTVPDTVETIGDISFSGSNITGVVIPSSVKTIGSEAFSFCNDLNTVSFSEGLEEIDISAFICCGALTSIELPSTLKTLSNGAFGSCINLEKITLNEGLETIEPGVFSSCESLKEVVIPNSVTSLGGSLFFRCTALEKVTLPESLAEIPLYLFGYCSSLKEFVVPENITAIESGAFYSCDALEKLTIENPDCSIYDSESTIAEGAVIYGYKGSTAELYAESYSRSFVALDEELPAVMKGDVNNDAAISGVDAAMVLADYAQSQTSGGSSFDESQFAAADVNGDGVITAVDAAKILSYYAYASTTPEDLLVSFEEFLAQ